MCQPPVEPIWKDSQIQQSLNDTLRQLASTIRAANEAVPGVVLATVVLTAVVVPVLLLSEALMLGTAVLLVLLISVSVYGRTGNYGEAAVALVAGLLTAFTVQWTAGRFVLFVAAYVGFTLSALIISSLRLAAREQEIYLDAAGAVVGGESPEVRRELEAIGKDRSVSTFGPIQRAEVIREFAYRKIPIALMSDGLKTVHTLSRAVGVDHLSMTPFVADLLKMFDATPQTSSDEWVHSWARKRVAKMAAQEERAPA